MEETSRARIVQHTADSLYKHIDSRRPSPPVLTASTRTCVLTETNKKASANAKDVREKESVCASASIAADVRASATGIDGWWVVITKEGGKRAAITMSIQRISRYIHGPSRGPFVESVQCMRYGDSGALMR